MTEFDSYQEEALRTSDRTNDGVNLGVCALGLCGESGEFADHVKKHIAQGHYLDREKLKLELGDILWYIAVAADALNEPLSNIVEMNVQKLRKRYPDGFSTERSVNRTV